ncbi:MAG: VPLPA-CTERM-specific exosortase XrtD [Parvularculaceae bacterium]
MAIAEEARTHLDSAGVRKVAALVAASAAILVVLYWDALINLWSRWAGQQELSHSYFIPLISLWLVWTNRKAIGASVGAPSWAGAALIAVAGLFLLSGQLTHIFLLQHVGLVIAIAGLVAGFGGLSLLRATAVPVAFLFFAVPPPYWVITILSWKFQQMSSVIGVAMIQMMDIPVYLSGNVIDLGDYRLQVAEACSGLRYLFPFLSLGVMTAYLFRGPLWQKLAIVVATVPITVVMNSFRVAVTAALVQAYGVEHAEGALHFFEGWVVFVLCLIALFGVVALFCLFSKPRRNPLDALGAPELKPITPSKGRMSTPLMATAIIGGLAATLALSQFASTESLVIPDRRPFAAVPQEFAGWRAEVLAMDPSVAEALAADDTIVANLVSPEGELVNIYLAYLDAQRDGRSWHSPRQCIPGGGWQIVKHDILKRKTVNGRSMAYNRLIIQQRDHQQLVYYWYDQRGRKLANEFVMKFWLIFDAVTRKRSDGAMVRLITPVTNAAGVEAADTTLQDTMARMETFLPAYVPN